MAAKHEKDGNKKVRRRGYFSLSVVLDELCCAPRNFVGF